MFEYVMSITRQNYQRIFFFTKLVIEKSFVQIYFDKFLCKK